MGRKEILLDSYALQKDLRIRLPKQILTNTTVSVGTVLDIYLDTESNDIILRVAADKTDISSDSK